jgi:GWxTD domain-containing protein
MKTLQPLCAALLLFLTCSAFAADPTLPELFKRAKDKFAAGDYKGSLADFELLDKNSSQPGFATDRAKLLPVITFYRGANLAALGRKSEAKDAFVTYLGFKPDAAIASPPFPTATVDVFEQARKVVASQSMSISGTYASFAAPAGWKLEADEHWLETPIRYLATPAQKKDYAALTSSADRAAFVETFWKDFDPTPGTPANELRAEFERRVAYADATFGTPKLAGRFTDRAAVFAFLGAPTYASQSDVTSGSDPMDQLRIGGAGGRELERQGSHGGRESWYYRTGRIPASVPFKEIRFDFITKEGYGSSVMQKDSEPMQTLGIAADAARRDKKLN